MLCLELISFEGSWYIFFPSTVFLILAHCSKPIYNFFFFFFFFFFLTETYSNIHIKFSLWISYGLHFSATKRVDGPIEVWSSVCFAAIWYSLKTFLWDKNNFLLWTNLGQCRVCILWEIFWKKFFLKMPNLYLLNDQVEPFLCSNFSLSFWLVTFLFMELWELKSDFASRNFFYINNRLFLLKSLSIFTTAKTSSNVSMIPPNLSSYD